jgi:hypothetical protein
MRDFLLAILIPVAVGCVTAAGVQEGQRRLVERHMAMCTDGAGASMWERQVCVSSSYAACQRIGLKPKCVEDSSESQYSRVP